MIDKLIKLANHLDSIGLSKEADFLDSLIKKEGSNSKDRGPYLGEIEDPWRGLRDWAKKHSGRPVSPAQENFNAMINEFKKRFGRNPSFDEVRDMMIFERVPTPDPEGWDL